MKCLAAIIIPLSLLVLAGCPDPFINDPNVVDMDAVPVVHGREQGASAVPDSEAPAEYYMYNNRFYVVIDEPAYVYKHDWKGFGEYYPMLYKGMDPLSYSRTAYRLSKYGQYDRYRHYDAVKSGDQLKAPTLKRALPKILVGEDDEDKE